MSTYTTLGGQHVVGNDMLIKGIIESITTVNQFYQVLPFKGIHGNALAYNRELKGQDPMSLVGMVGTGHTSINKDAQHFSRHSTELTTLIGDAQVNGLVQAVGSDFNDATAIQVGAKAKGIGRKFMDDLINGTSASAVDGYLSANNTVVYSVFILELVTALTKMHFTHYTIGNAEKAVTVANLDTDFKKTSGFIQNIFGAANTVALGTVSGDTLTLLAGGIVVQHKIMDALHGQAGFDGLDALVSTDMTVTATVADSNAYFTHLDELIDTVQDKDGMVDYIMMHSRGVRDYTSHLRGVSAAGYDDVMEVKMSSGGVMKVQSYRGVPIFRNDFIQTGWSSGAKHMYLGTLDDGTFSHGISGLTASQSAGLQVQKIGAREDVDAEITRVKWYCGMANFSELGLVKGVTS